jgi:hypothetical protein
LRRVAVAGRKVRPPDVVQENATIHHEAV